MASKSELLDAQSFSRRRLLTAFVSGAPGGRELEPAKPLRGVIAGVALSVIVLVVGLFVGLLVKGLPDDWGDGKLIIDQSTGSRYVSIDNELWPVLNIASARLLLDPAASADPVVVSGGLLTGIPVRDTLGIPGAPDTLPAASNLVNTGWTACIVGGEKGGIDARIGAEPIASARTPTDATVVTVDDRIFVVAGSLRMEVPAEKADAILRDVGLGSAAQHAATATWLNLFEEGHALAPFDVRGAGGEVPGSDVRVGDVISTTADATTRYLVLSDGSLAELTPLAFALYQHGKSYSAENTYTVETSEIASMPNTTTPVTSPDWPAATFDALPSSEVPCALTETRNALPATVLASTPATTKLSVRTTVEASAGALVRITGVDQQTGGQLMLIDSTATSYGIPAYTTELLAKLGYTDSDVGDALAPWTMLFAGGPDLTEAAAGSPSNGSAR